MEWTEVWRRLHEFGAAARYNAAMSGGQGSLVLMGGIVSTSPTAVPSGDTWQLSWNLWTQIGEHRTGATERGGVGAR